jgi:pectate lyase
MVWLVALGAASCGDEVLTTLRPPPTARFDAGPPPPPPPGGCDKALVGFAAQDGGTIGGFGGTTVEVSTAADLRSSAAMTGPLVIQVSGMIVLPGGQLDVSSFKTIVGADRSSGLLGGGLNVTGVENVIIQNLVIEKAVGTDAITISGSRHVWVDHCDLSSDMVQPKGYYGGLVDIVYGSDDVTVSWTRLHDHFHPSVIGGDDKSGAEDTGHLTVTFHHNLFENTYSYNPSIRFGSLHAFNNHYVNLISNGISSRMGARVLAEANVFDMAHTPLTTHLSESPMDGYMNDQGNIFDSSTANDITQPDTWTPPYSYKAEPAAEAATLVAGCAGPGNI